MNARACLALTFAVLAAAWTPAAASAAMTLTTTTFPANGTMPLSTVYNGNGCQGDDRSPALAWSGVPPAAKSFALTVEDPDAGQPTGWWHWVRFNIPGDVRGLPADAGAQSLTQRGPGLDALNTYLENAYGGPCPPPGDKPHRYIFTLYALDVATVRQFSTHATGPQLVAAIRGHVLAQAQLIGHYGR